MSQLSIYDIMFDKYKIDKKIRLIELFAGYGSQALALKYLGANFEHYKICEWATKSIQAYNDLHVRDYTDYASWKSMDYIYNFLYEKGISLDYNSPMTLDQIKRKGDSWCKTVYNNIIATKNLVNIMKVKAADLCITNTDKYTYLLTYSFPCQDLSLAGLTKGMEKGSGTRSGLLWEVERILEECRNTKPQVLLMENVTQVHGSGNEKSFSAWVKKLEELGYSNYIQDMIATDYCIPQTRDRTFMVSILGDYAYNFPQPMKLPIKLKDLLEKEVPEKFYLSDRAIKGIENSNFDCSKIENRTEKDGVMPTLCARDYKDPKLVIETKTNRLGETINNNLDKLEDSAVIDSYNNQIKNDGEMITITTRTIPSNNTFIAVKNATKTGYLKAEDGDGVDIYGRMQYHRGTVQKGKAQTLSTMGGENTGVVVLKKELCNQLIKDNLVEDGDIIKHNYTGQIMSGNKKCVEKNDGNMITLTTRGDTFGVVVGTYQYSKSNNFMQGKDRFKPGKDVADTIQTKDKEGVVILGNYSPSNHNASRIIDSNYAAPTVMENHGTITAVAVTKNYIQWKEDGYHDLECRAYFEDKVAPTTTTTPKGKILQNDLRIRKLTPRECWRLMGVVDNDFNLVCKSQSDASLYHLAGDSIVTTCLMGIFGELLGINYKQKILELIQELREKKE